jgi:hypothetical protein
MSAAVWRLSMSALKAAVGLHTQFRLRHAPSVGQGADAL